MLLGRTTGQFNLRRNGSMHGALIPTTGLKETIGSGTAKVLRTLVASKVLGWKLPHTRDGYK
jgi:hypothetical protein